MGDIAYVSKREHKALKARLAELESALIAWRKSVIAWYTNWSPVAEEQIRAHWSPESVRLWEIAKAAQSETKDDAQS